MWEEWTEREEVDRRCKTGENSRHRKKMEKCYGKEWEVGERRSSYRRENNIRDEKRGDKSKRER